MNLVVFFFFTAIGIYVFLKFTKKGKQLHILQSPLELLLTTHQEINEELQTFIQHHDFSKYKPNVGVFGENSTGKSTFLNAMLGTKDEFKMGFGETTNKITVLYKNRKPVSAGKKGFSQLYTQKNYKKMDYRHLNYMNLFDIPGFGQQFSHKELSKVIQEIDIVFWFIDISKGVKKDDKLFLENIKGLDTKVIVVLNKIDAISDNHEIDDLLKDINSQILKIKTFFKEEKVKNNLVTIFPFSATKSLVNTLKGEEGVFKVIDKIIENVLLYTVFIESYRGYVEESFYFDEDLFLLEANFQDGILNTISKASKGLENELKENISFGSSINPFSSKNEEAEPIVLDYITILEDKLENYNNFHINRVDYLIKKKLKNLDSFRAFIDIQEFEFHLDSLDSLDIKIDLNSIAWNSFWGDSFAEEVTNKFEKKISKKVQRQLPKLSNQYKNSITSFQKNLAKNTKEFAHKLDKKLLKTNKQIQEPLLTLLLKAVKDTLDEKDHKYIEKMLKIK